MANDTARDTSQVLALLRASLGDIDPKKSLKRLFEDAPQCGPFEWMLTILAIEIDLRVDVPEKLSDNRKQTAAQFADKVSRLPKVASSTYTLDCLGLVAQALLLLEPVAEDEPARTKRAKTQRKQPAKRTQPKSTPVTTPRSNPRKAGSKKAPPNRKSTAKR
jgi:hypothetical protein